jgi:hypothetical protein
MRMNLSRDAASRKKDASRKVVVTMRLRLSRIDELGTI